MAGRPGEGGCCQVRIEQGSTPLGQGAGESHRSAQQSLKKETRRSRKEKKQAGKQGKQSQSKPDRPPSLAAVTVS